jgi:hypothetical protein
MLHLDFERAGLFAESLFGDSASRCSYACVMSALWWEPTYKSHSHGIASDGITLRCSQSCIQRGIN